MSERFTICLECQFHLRISDSNIWYDQYCKAEPLPQKRDPFDGKMKSINQMGSAIGPPAYQHCQDVNIDGNCPHFKQK